MPCYNPTRVIMDGDHRVQFSKDWRWAQYLDGETRVNLPCRQCIGCNMAKQREWSVRCFHEALLHSKHWQDPDTKITTAVPNNCILTLTYRDDELPPDRALDHEHFQLFMKRLRQKRHREWLKLPKPRPKHPVQRYMMCGEYGAKFHRPHFHVILFGENFSDRYDVRLADGQLVQMSWELNDLWTKGNATVDDFSFAGAAYVAGYVAKKQVQNGQHLGPIEERVDPTTGTVRILPKSPEYRQMSRRPGLGYDWIRKHLEEVYDDDSVRISEWTFHPPKYYDQVLEEERPDLVGTIKSRRRDGMSKAAEDWSPERCSAAEQIALEALQQRRDSL